MVVVGESPAVFHDIMIEKGVVLKVQLGGGVEICTVCLWHRLLWVFSKYGWMGWWFLWVGSEIKEK